MGIAGISWWTTDIGGFSGGEPSDPDFRELLIRWFQWGCFCPVMRLHGDRRPSSAVYRKDGNISLFTGSDNEVWSFGTEAYEILVKYIKLRELLRPYTRSLMRDAHENGTPVIRRRSSA
jgi:alpha-D-xyloside xylohydrolase